MISYLAKVRSMQTRPVWPASAAPITFTRPCWFQPVSPVLQDLFHVSREPQRTNRSGRLEEFAFDIRVRFETAEFEDEENSIGPYGPGLPSRDWDDSRGLLHRSGCDPPSAFAPGNRAGPYESCVPVSGTARQKNSLRTVTMSWAAPAQPMLTPGVRVQKCPGAGAATVDPHLATSRWTFGGEGAVLSCQGYPQVGNILAL